MFSSMREWIDIYLWVRAEVFQINFSRGFAKRATSKLNPGDEGRGKALLYESDGETSSTRLRVDSLYGRRSKEKEKGISGASKPPPFSLSNACQAG